MIGILADYDVHMEQQHLVLQKSTYSIFGPVFPVTRYRKLQVYGAIINKMYTGTW
jgi:hypothetical protein